MKSKKEILKKIEEYEDLEMSKGQSNYYYVGLSVASNLIDTWSKTYKQYCKDGSNNFGMGIYYSDSEGKCILIPLKDEGLDAAELADSSAYEDGIIDTLIWLRGGMYYGFQELHASHRYESKFGKCKIVDRWKERL